MQRQGFVNILRVACLGSWYPTCNLLDRGPQTELIACRSKTLAEEHAIMVKDVIPKYLGEKRELLVEAS